MGASKLANGASRSSRSATSRRHSSTSPSVWARARSGLWSTQASAVRRHHPARGMPAARASGQVSGAATANSRNPAPNQNVESRVAAALRASPESASIATTARPARARAPRCSSVQLRMLSWPAPSGALAPPPGAGTTSQAGRTSSGRAVRATPPTGARGLHRCARRATAATRSASHTGSAVAAAAMLGKPRGGGTWVQPAPNASCSSRSRSILPPATGEGPRATPGATTYAASDPSTSAPQATSSARVVSRSPHARLASTVATPSTSTKRAPGRRTATIAASTLP